MSRLSRVTFPLVCAFLLLVAQGSPTQAQTASISCENLDGDLLCTMTVSDTPYKIAVVLWTGTWPDRLSGGNQFRVTPGPGDCGEVFHITGQAHRFVGDIGGIYEDIFYTRFATASIDYTWDCSSSTPTTPTTPTGGDTGGSTPTGGDTGGSTTTGGDTGGSTTAGGDTGGSDTIAEETLTDGAKILLTVEPTAISEDDGATDVVVTATLDGLDGQVFDDDVVVLLTFDEDINGDGAVNNDDKAAVLDTDYVTELRLLTIPPDSVSGTMTITITPINDKKVEGDETIRLRLARSYPNNQVTVQDAEGD
ncbi:MAG: hypothetical protein F4Z57_14095, partial [Gemmatimonadetes bacterium]|nr:hypothetical protein [Gemmatimonadota bacterium]